MSTRGKIYLAVCVLIIILSAVIIMISVREPSGQNDSTFTQDESKKSESDSVVSDESETEQEFFDENVDEEGWI